MNRKGEILSASVIVLSVLTVIGGVIGLGIVDSVTKEAVNPTTVINETHTITAVPQSFSTTNIPVVSGSFKVQTNSGNATLVLNTNYTVLDYTTGTINITSYNLNQGSTLRVTYAYEGEEYYSSALSRTIVTYIVPVALLGLLAFVAGIYFLRG